MKSVFLILLGCNISSLLMDRILTSINFIENNIDNFNKITWYLSGGIKFDGELSEASIMKNELNFLIENKIIKKNIEFNYILDEASKINTMNLLYTAITRSKKKCILISEEKTIETIINEKRKTKRICNLKDFC